MEWIVTTEFIEMLKRFPDTKIRAKRYLGSFISSTHVWQYCKVPNKFSYHLNGKIKHLTERGFLRAFASDHWRPEPFFFLDEKQKTLAARIVEHLIMTGKLEWIILECDMNFVRQCNHCHKLMNKGWMCGEAYKFCCDECLLAENPEISREKLYNRTVDDNSDIYWTEWEG